MPNDVITRGEGEGEVGIGDPLPSSSRPLDWAAAMRPGPHAPMLDTVIPSYRRRWSHVILHPSLIIIHSGFLTDWRIPEI